MWLLTPSWSSAHCLCWIFDLDWNGWRRCTIRDCHPIAGDGWIICGECTNLHGYHALSKQKVSTDYTNKMIIIYRQSARCACLNGRHSVCTIYNWIPLQQTRDDWRTRAGTARDAINSTSTAMETTISYVYMCPISTSPCTICLRNCTSFHPFISTKL